MTYIDFLIERIKAYVDTHPMTSQELADLARIAEGSARRVKSKVWNPTAGTLRRLELIIPPDFKPINFDARHIQQNQEQKYK